MERHRQIEGRSPVDVLLAHAAELEQWAERQEDWSRDWRSSPGQREYWRKGAAQARREARGA